MTRPLEGYRAWVSGGSRGIGRATARALARHGAAVTVAARDATALDDVVKSLDGPGAHRAVVVDLTDTDGLARHVADALADGPIHILINNGGGPPGGPIVDAPADAFETWFRHHLLANQLLAQALLPGMREAGYGRIVNVISTSVKQPIPGLGVSNTIRGAVANWAKTLAGEVAPDGITVNNVLPGATRTDRLDGIIAARARAGGQSEDDVARDIRRQIPARRFGEADEIAAAIAFLAGPDAAYITGVNLPVDGGRTACL